MPSVGAFCPPCSASSVYYITVHTLLLSAFICFCRIYSLFIRFTPRTKKERDSLPLSFRGGCYFSGSLSTRIVIPSCPHRVLKSSGYAPMTIKHGSPCFITLLAWLNACSVPFTCSMRTYTSGSIAFKNDLIFMVLSLSKIPYFLLPFCFRCGIIFKPNGAAVASTAVRWFPRALLIY